MTPRRLPVAVWAGLATGGAAATVGAAELAVLLPGGRLPARAVPALAVGCLAGLAVAVLAVLAAVRFTAGLQCLLVQAARTLQDPAAPVAGGRGAVRLTAELDELAALLEALHLRVRLADQVAARARLEAETAGAGVFELLSGLVAAEEGARGQLAAELHDTVAQSLMVARALLAQPALSPGDLVRLTDHVEDAEEQLRAVMARTRPPALREGDLAVAVADLRLDLAARYALALEVHWPASAHPLPLASAITVYRFFQEALLNVVKHADVEVATVELVVDEHLVTATVRDAGPGFDPTQVRPERGRHVGLGLLGERARLSGGRLEVQSQPGDGTTLTLRLPRRGGLPGGQEASCTGRLLPQPPAVPLAA